MGILGSNVNFKEIVQIACITTVLLLMATLSFWYMAELEITYETIPVLIISALLTISLSSLGIGTYKWYFWIKNPVISREIFFSPIFFMWFIITIEILLAMSVYYTYYNFPDFKYGFIFDIAGVLIIVGMLYFLVGMVYVSAKDIDVRKFIDIIRERLSKK